MTNFTKLVLNFLIGEKVLKKNTFHHGQTVQNVINSYYCPLGCIGSREESEVAGIFTYTDNGLF